MRTWGSTSQLNISDDFFSVHQAWGEYAISDKLSLKVGRQELVYDNHRIFGNVGWAQQARSHDLALLKYNKIGLFQLHFGFAYNQDKEQLTGNFYTTPKNYKTMQFLWIRKEMDHMGGSFLLLNNGVQYVNSVGVSSVQFSQTLGTYMNFDLGSFKLNVSGYYQMGKDPSGKGLSATYLAAEIVKPLDWGLAPAFGVELLSGTDGNDLSDPNARNHSFTPLYGTNHKFNGFMDYFYVGNHNNNVGLRDIYLSSTYKHGKLTPMAALHYFMSAAKVPDPINTNNTLKNFLGVELDLVLGIAMGDHAGLKIGYSQMFARETMEAIKGGDRKVLNNWAWVMLSFTPEFLNQ